MKHDSAQFLEENFKKLFNYRLAFSALEDELKVWLDRTLEEFASQQTSGITLGTRSGAKRNKGAGWLIYFTKARLPKDKVFDEFAIWIYYSAKYDFDGHSGYFPQVWIHPRKNAAIDLFTSFASKNLSDLTAQFGPAGVVASREDGGIILVQEDDDKGTYQPAPTLDKLRKDIFVLGNELLRLAREFSEKQ